MATIDINTTQNVIIQYSLASLRDRILAYILDATTMFAIYYLMSLVLQGFLGAGESIVFAEYLILLPFLIFYTLAWEIFANGQTLGKRILGLRVARVDGQQAQISDYILRWSMRCVDIYLSLGGVASVLISSTENQQRLGGMLSNTVVLRLKPETELGLKDILRINTLSNYEPQFPQITQMKEEDMLLIKSAVERYMHYRNDAHREAIKELCQRISDELNIPVPEKGKLDFLKTLIKDYIVLTR